MDVRRERFLNEIHEGFDRGSVVVIRSASGQGKTTLAYRYLKDFTPAEFRFEVQTLSDLNHARRVALALVRATEALEVPTVVYIDVRPGETHWKEIVRQLAMIDGIRVLLTIREEDWARSDIHTDFSYSDIVLSFGEEEAREFYQRLQGEPSQHLDLQDAWNQFGKRKTLLEFVYYITQQESLTDRITSQIKSLQDEVRKGDRQQGELDLLRFVAVASAYEARLCTKSLVKACDLPAPKRTLEHFCDEYLIRVSESGQNVEGFNSIRSEIICQVLTDPVLMPWSEVAAQSLPMLVEEDLHGFLLCAFSRHSSDSDLLIAELAAFHPQTWAGIQGVTSALLWHGLRMYCEENAELQQEVFEQIRSGWWFTLDWDLARLTGDNGFSILEDLQKHSMGNEETVSYAEAARARQTDKDRVSRFVRDWLNQWKGSPLPPEDARQFAAVAEVMFWIGHWDMATPLREAVREELLDEAFQCLPVDALGEFLLGFRTCCASIYEGWLSSHRESLVNRIRQEGLLFHLAEEDHRLVAHYIITPDRQTSSLSNPTTSTAQIPPEVHDLSLERVELLARLFPGKERYGAVGYGHRTSLVELPFDDAEKSGVLAESMFPNWARRFNGLARGCAEHRFRPENWTEYFSSLRTLRENILAALKDLQRTIVSLRKVMTSGSTVTITNQEHADHCNDLLRGEFPLPKIAVDDGDFSPNRCRDQIQPKLPGFLRLAVTDTWVCLGSVLFATRSATTERTCATFCLRLIRVFC